MKTGIYSFVNLVNGKRYIGQSFKLNIRINEHFSKLVKNKDACPKLQRAWNKYGCQNFVVETIISTDGNFKKEQLKCFLDFLEKYYIQHYDSFDNGYNCTKGGDGGLGRVGELNPMYKIGEKHPMFGKKPSEKSIKKNSLSHMGLQVGRKNPKWVEKETIKCKKCGKIFQALPKKNRIYCSHKCFIDDYKAVK
jgi:group I intron endonuclease